MNKTAHEYLVLMFSNENSATPATKEELILAVKGMQPTFQKSGEDKTDVTGGTRASRTTSLKVKVEFVTMIIDVDDSLNKYAHYFDLKRLLQKYEYVWFKETDLVRLLPDGSNLWKKLLPCKFELIEEELSPLFEEGADSYTATWQARTNVTLKDIYNG